MRVERTFDHFILLETLGFGGMGTVYKARDTLLDRLVALKLLRKDLAGDHPFLFFPVGDYLIVYRPDRKPVLILAIVHGNRDIPTFLRSRRL